MTHLYHIMLEVTPNGVQTNTDKFDIVGGDYTTYLEVTNKKEAYDVPVADLGNITVASGGDPFVLVAWCFVQRVESLTRLMKYEAKRLLTESNTYTAQALAVLQTDINQNT